ncbi:MAG TPA: hypothetical protein VEJ43_03010 [Pseudolabrys sp.]|nr:hypothetical protein [Pseudolabrys sp.]
MKALVATAALLILSVAAGAKPAPVNDLKSLDDEAMTLARNDADINIGPTGDSRAALERHYFQAPEFNAGSFYCRRQSIVFDKTRLAQSCD